MFEGLHELLRNGSQLTVDKTGHPTGEDIQVAIAAFLIAVAGSDSRFDENEFDVLFRAMARHFQISDERNVQLLEIADFLRREKGKLDEFAEIVNQAFDRSQKQTVLGMLLKVVVADGVVTETEKNKLGQVMELLELDQSDLRKAEELLASETV